MGITLPPPETEIYRALSRYAEAFTRMCERRAEMQKKPEEQGTFAMFHLWYLS